MDGEQTTDEPIDGATDADFAAGFDDAPTVTPGNDTAATDDAPAANQEPEPQAPPKLAQITEEQFNDILTRANSIDEIKGDLSRKLDTAFGKIGEVNRLIAKFQGDTPAGQPVQLTDEDFAELRGEYPEVSEAFLAGLGRVLGRMKGTGSFDPSQVEQMVQQRLGDTLKTIPQTVESLVSERMLKKEFGNWREIVGSPDDSKNEFRQWLATQPAERQSELNETHDSEVIGQAIRDFNEVKKRAKAVDQRKSRMEAAATPRGTPGFEPASGDDEDEFNAGFKSG